MKLCRLFPFLFPASKIYFQVRSAPEDVGFNTETVQQGSASTTWTSGALSLPCDHSCSKGRLSEVLAEKEWPAGWEKDYICVMYSQLSVHFQLIGFNY